MKNTMNKTDKKWNDRLYHQASWDRKELNYLVKYLNDYNHKREIADLCGFQHRTDKITAEHSDMGVAWLLKQYKRDGSPGKGRVFSIDQLTEIKPLLEAGLNQWTWFIYGQRNPFTDRVTYSVGYRFHSNNGSSFAYTCSHLTWTYLGIERTAEIIPFRKGA